MAATPMRLGRLNDDGSTVTVQGFTLQAPPSPSGQGQFVTLPTVLQTVAKTQIEVQPANPNTEQPPVITTVVAQFHWTAVYQAEAQKAPASQSVAVTTGVTSSEADQVSFATSIGMQSGVSLEGISDTLNVSFTATMGVTTTIALTNSTTTTNTYSVPPETTGQFWQLIQVFSAEDGSKLEQPLDFFLALTFPA